MQFADSEATIQFRAIAGNGSMWITVMPTPTNHSPEEIADAYREVGVEMAKLIAESWGYVHGSPSVPPRSCVMSSLAVCPKR